MKLQPGRILEFVTPRGNAYAQYVSRHGKYGDTIRVLPGFFEERPTDFSKMAKEHAYFAFYPAGAAVAQGLAVSVATLPIPPGYERPKRMRRRGAITRDGRVLTWLLMEEGGSESLRTHLTAEERRLPIASIWNHAMLIHRLCEEWSPEKEGLMRKEEPPGSQPGSTAPPAKAFEVSHFLYFPSQDSATSAGADLIARGLAVTVRPSVEEGNWLVLASQSVPAEGIDSLDDELLRQVAETHSGTYDGRETKVIS